MIVTADSIERGQKSIINLPLCYNYPPALTAAAELSVNLPNRDDFGFQVLECGWRSMQPTSVWHAESDAGAISIAKNSISNSVGNTIGGISSLTCFHVSDWPLLEVWCMHRYNSNRWSMLDMD
jgi:hypothetical protein